MHRGPLLLIAGAMASAWVSLGFAAEPGPPNAKVIPAGDDVAARGESAANDADVAKARAWVESQIEALHRASAAGAEPLLQDVDIRKGLKAAGLDPFLADAVGDTLDPSEILRPKRILRALETTRSRLNGLARAMTRRPPEAFPASRDRLERILRDPVFLDAAREPDLVTRIAQRVRGLFAQLYATLAETANRHPKVLPWIVGVLIAGAVVLFLMMFRRVFVPLRARGALPRAAGLASAGLVRPPAKDLLEGARRARVVGRLVEALALSDRAAIAALRHRGLLPPAAGMTDLEGVRWLAARADPESHFAFGRLVEICDRSLYGGIPATDAAASEAEALAGRLLEVPDGDVEARRE